MPSEKDETAGGTPKQPSPLVRRIDTRELLGTERTLQIEHKGKVYTLRLTRNDRLILTK